MEMKNLRNFHEDEEDDEEYFLPKKGGSSQKDGKSSDQKPNNPRSKHSATEQRRRSKINDRFQILRDLIPQDDHQKRDKASFLLEVIEYIQSLQEKANRYEGTCQGWNQEPVKLTPWRNGHAPSESMIARSGPIPSLMFSGKFDDNVSPTILTNEHNSIDSDLSIHNAYNSMTQHSGLIPLHANMLTADARGGGLAQSPERAIFAAENVGLLPQMSQSKPYETEYSVTAETMREQDDLAIESGSICIAGVYSQRLLDNLTQALRSSGVDLSQANISVQIDLGKRAISRLGTCTPKDKEDRFENEAMENSGDGSHGEDVFGQAQKRPRR